MLVEVGTNPELSKCFVESATLIIYGELPTCPTLRIVLVYFYADLKPYCYCLE